MKRLQQNMITVLLILSSLIGIRGTSGDALRVISGDSSLSCFKSSENEELKISSRIFELLFDNKEEGKVQEQAAKSVVSEDEETRLLIPGGTVFGAKVNEKYVRVTEVRGASTLKAGDKIIAFNDKRIECAQDLKSELKESKSDKCRVTVIRGEKTLRLLAALTKDSEGKYSLGITVRDSASGIGTVTYIDPKTGDFGGLGHGICDSETGELIDISSGKATGVILGEVKKGESGSPGELSGILTEKRLGEIYENTELGIFGCFDNLPSERINKAIEVGKREDVHTGDATIISTVKMGYPKEYKIEITEVDPSSTGSKSFKIKVTDPALIAISGGVVRGMSGSPVIQDGKLVGAVTHVMINSPTEGYGIFIENMLATAQNQITQRSA